MKQCNKCLIDKEDSEFRTHSRKNGKMVPVGRFKDWNQYVARLFTGPGNLQVLCKKCHQKKTSEDMSA